MFSTCSSQIGPHNCSSMPRDCHGTLLQVPVPQHHDSGQNGTKDTSAPFETNWPDSPCETRALHVCREPAQLYLQPRNRKDLSLVCNHLEQTFCASSSHLVGVCRLATNGTGVCIASIVIEGLRVVSLGDLRPVLLDF